MLEALVRNCISSAEGKRLCIGSPHGVLTYLNNSYAESQTGFQYAEVGEFGSIDEAQ